jgi:hypothetical protein
MRKLSIVHVNNTNIEENDNRDENYKTIKLEELDDEIVQIQARFVVVVFFTF